MSERDRTTRRGFLKHTAAAGAAAAAPWIVSARALGKDGAAPASDRIVMGGAGIGGRGTADIMTFLQDRDVQFAAVCDVRGERRKQAKDVVDQKYGNRDCAAYIDLREMLARADIDAVFFATGDRWHALASTLAMKAGKDVYCEKPCSLTVAQSRAVAEAARRYARVYQAGTQRRSEEPFLFIVLLARAGLLGKLHTVRAHIWTIVPKDVWLPPVPEPPREVVDWDLFVGPALWRPYNPGYLGWYGHAFLHGGTITDWGSHTIDLCQWAGGTDDTSPVRYACPENDTGHGLVARFGDGLKLVLTTTGFPGSCGVRFEGSEGWAEASDGAGATFAPKSLAAERKRLVQSYLAQTHRPLSHHRDFLDCVKTRRPTVANADVAHHVHTTVHVSSICVKLGRDVTWDPAKEEFVGDDQANRLRSAAMREPWRV